MEKNKVYGGLIIRPQTAYNDEDDFFTKFALWQIWGQKS